MKLPELTINPREFHVDATPNGQYAIRILECYRERARCKFKVEGADEGGKELYDYMNECQDKRVKELDEAIRILKGSK